jgi:aminoglycoside phosphotransferase
MLTVAAPSEPLHRLAVACERSRVIEILGEVLDELWGPEFAVLSWSDPVSDELSCIETLICDPGFDSQLFQDLTAWRSADEALSWAREEVAKHERDVFSRGALCLPNIHWDEENAAWWLVDVGSAGRANRCRDLSALAGSLNRNLGDGAYSELIRVTWIPDDPQKRAVCELLDHFWSTDKRLGLVGSPPLDYHRGLSAVIEVRSD